MKSSIVRMGQCAFEVLSQEQRFLGLGKVWIGTTLVRSGRLPACVYTQTFQGHESADLHLEDIVANSREVRVRLRASFKPMRMKLMRDHSIDPIHDLGDWHETPPSGQGQLDLVLRPARDTFGGRKFTGFSYHWDYRSDSTPIFYWMDQSSWELDGDIAGCTVVSQSSCSDPIVTFGKQTSWSTEGVMHWATPTPNFNHVMTHNLPRWASHQAFDFQYRGHHTLLGVFEKVDLIRSVVCRDAGKCELKVFDKHIFDQAKRCATTPKAILLNSDAKTEVDQQNLWTWTIQEVHDRARAEYGLKEEPCIPRLSHNYWDNFIIDTYRKDLLPCAVSLGLKELFIDNMNKSAATERTPGPDYHWNMCCSDEYKVAPRLGGEPMLKAFIDDCRALGIRPLAWTSLYQSKGSPVCHWWKEEYQDWFVKMEDTRTKWAGAYTNVPNSLNIARDSARRYWVDGLKQVKDATGLDGYLLDSWYNQIFMPVSYADCAPSTQWKAALACLKEMQDYGIRFMIESFGPFGMVQHGCPTSYNVGNLFACYKVGMGTGYTTIPSGHDKPRREPWPVPTYYRILAHMSDPGHSLFMDGRRLDTLFTPGHRQALADYNCNCTHMHRRFLQEDGKAVLWHDRAGRRATLWNFADRTLALPGMVTDLTTGQRLPKATRYRLKALHTYAIQARTLPERIGS